MEVVVLDDLDDGDVDVDFLGERLRDLPMAVSLWPPW